MAKQDTLRIYGSQAGTTYPTITGRELCWSEAIPGQLIIGNISDSGTTYDTIGRRVTKAAGSPVGTVVPMNVGEIYVNSSNGDVYISDALTNADWSQVNGAGTGDLLASNNLSEVNATTATQNLGVEVGVDVQAYNAALTNTTGTYTTTNATTLSTALQINPALGTPVSGVATNLTGTAAGLTCGAVTGVEAGADVTDATNVAAALTNGVAALTSGEVTQLANIGTNAISNAEWGYLAGTSSTFTSTLKTKIDGIATGATVNSTNATLLARANHTGTQLMSTISNAGALATLGQVDTAQIATDAVTEAKLDNALLAKINNTVPGKFNATTAPGVTNDVNDTGASDGVGYQVGSVWIDTTANEAYRAVDVTNSAAIWINTTLTTGELGNLATLNTVDTAQIDANAVTLAKLDTMATDSFLGRTTGGTGAVEVLSAAQTITVLGASPTANYMVKMNGSGTGFVYQDGVDGGTWT